MTTDSIGGKTSQLKTMTIKAWRERWTASQFATQVKAVLGRGVSGDVYNLADCLLQQALTGPAPNQLLLSLLSHCLASQLVSYSSTLHTIAKFSSFSRPHCTAALLTLLLAHKPHISCRSHRPEESLSLATGLVAVSTWALSTTTQTITRLVELRESKVDLVNLARVQELLAWLSSDTQAICLSYTGRIEDTELHQELVTNAKAATKACDQIYLFASEDSSTALQLRSVIEAVEVLEPSVDICRGVSGPESHTELSYSLHSIISFDAVLAPTSDLNQLSGHLNTIMTIKSVPMSTLVCQLVRCCLLAMNEHDGFEVLKWDAFTLIKLPRLVAIVVRDAGKGEVYTGLKRVLDNQALLDTTDARCKGANSYELLVRSMKTLMTDKETEELLAIRQTQLDKRKVMDLKSAPDSRDVNLIIKADSTLGTIIQTFENRSTEQSEFENLLSVMFHIIKGSSFDLLLSASAANGSLTALVTKLLLFNEGCKESPGESVRVSQNRAALFDMTFLMLVYIIQCFGSDVVLTNTQNCFFSQWARVCMTEPGYVKPLSGWSGCELASVGDSLLQQVMGGEVRTQVVLWHNVCNSVHLVMKEMMTAVEVNMISSDTFSKMCKQLYSKLCCLPVCVLSWLVSHSHYGLAQDRGISPLEVMDKFVDIHVDADMEGDGLPYFQQRSTMMVNIVKRMKQELETGEKKTAGNVETTTSWLSTRDESLAEDRSDTSLEDEMTRVWDGLWSLGRLDIAGTKQVARLYSLGGPEWFVTVLVERLVSCVYYEDVDRAGEVIFSLLHIDLTANTLALLLHVLPRCLAGEGKEPLLVHPSGRSLAKLTVDLLAACLSMRSSKPYCRAGQGRAQELVSLCDGTQQPVKLRKLNSGETLATDLGEAASQEQLVEAAHRGLFSLLAGMGMEPVLTPRLEFVCHILEQAALLGSAELSRQVLAPLPSGLVTQLVRLRPERFTMQTILRMFDKNTNSGRKNMSRLLCLMRNVQADRTSVSTE